MKTQEEYALEIDEIVRRDVEDCQSDWFRIDKEIFMQPGNKDITGHQWSLNRYENDLLTAGCHRIAYNEMERIAKQLGWV